MPGNMTTLLLPPEERKQRITMREYLMRQNRIIFQDPTHRDFTRLAVHHEPSESDLYNHWITGGGARDFAAENRKILQRKIILIDMYPAEHELMIKCIEREGHILKVIPNAYTIHDTIRELGGIHLIIIGPKAYYDDIFEMAHRLHEDEPYVDIIVMTDHNPQLAALLKRNGDIYNYHLLTNPNCLLELHAEMEQKFEK